MIIDIDAHFEPGPEWLADHPKLAARLPALPPGEMALDGIAGDLLRDVPRDEWPPIDDLVPPGMATLFGKERADEAARREEFAGRNQFEIADAAARVKWLDQQRIDVQNVICLSAYGYSVFVDDPLLLRDTVRACNRWLADTCEASAGRLLPVATLDYHDLDWAIEELTQMRARGSRIFLVPGAPVDGVPPCHPDWDRLWAAAVDLAMTPMLHIGFEHARFDAGWANLGTDTTALRMIASSQINAAAQLFVYSMIYNGVFERTPKLTLLLAELGVGWMPFLHREIDGKIEAASQLFLGEWKYPLKPSEYMERNVRGTPLGWGKDTPLDQIMTALPDDMIVFSSDFPHFEGYVDPMGHYHEALSTLSEARRERFYGAAMQDVYARMGDPVTIP